MSAGTVDLFLRVFRQEREWTRTLVASIPEDRFGWRPHEKDFTLGGMVRHLMQAERFWCRLLTSSAAGESYDPFQLSGSGGERLAAFAAPNVEAAENAKYGTTFAEALEKWEPIQVATEKALGEIPESALAVRVHHPLTTLEAPLDAMLWFMISHEVHHRGQLAAAMKSLDLPIRGPYGAGV